MPQHARLPAQARRDPLRSGAPHPPRTQTETLALVRPVHSPCRSPAHHCLTRSCSETGEHTHRVARDLQGQGDRLRQRVPAPRPALLVCAVARLPRARGGAGPPLQPQGRHVVARLHPDGALHGQAALRQSLRSGSALAHASAAYARLSSAVAQRHRCPLQALLASHIALRGPFPESMIQEGQLSHHYFDTTPCAFCLAAGAPPL